MEIHPFNYANEEDDPLTLPEDYRFLMTWVRKYAPELFAYPKSDVRIAMYSLVYELELLCDFQRPSIRWSGLENTWKVYADRATGRGLAWLDRKKKPSSRKNGRKRGLEKKEMKTGRGSVFYRIEKMQRPGQNASYSPMG